MAFGYMKLLGRIKERGYTQDTLAQKVGVSSSTLSAKLNNKSFFTQHEMRKICDLLEIDDTEVGAYFFAPKVQKN